MKVDLLAMYKAISNRLAGRAEVSMTLSSVAFVRFNYWLGDHFFSQCINLQCLARDNLSIEDWAEREAASVLDQLKSHGAGIKVTAAQ